MGPVSVDKGHILPLVHLVSCIFTAFFFSVETLIAFILVGYPNNTMKNRLEKPIVISLSSHHPIRFASSAPPPHPNTSSSLEWLGLGSKSPDVM